MFKLEILYTNLSTNIVKGFKTREAAKIYVYNEGDHVLEYKVKECVP